MEPISADVTELPEINGHTVPDQLDVTNGRGIGELNKNMGIRIVKLSAEHSIAVMPVDGNRQPIGLLHGGAYCVIGETLGSMSANVHAKSLEGGEFFAVGIDLNATHTASATSGWVTAECTAIKLGGSLTVHEIVVRDEHGTRCSTVRITNLIRKRK